MAEDGTRLGRAFISIIVDRPWHALLLGLALLGALAPGLQFVHPQFNYRVWFAPDDPLLQTFDAFERRFGNDQSAIVLVHSPSGIFDVESATLLRDLTDKMWTVPEVIRVDSLSNFNWVHDEEDDLIVEPLIPDIEDLEELDQETLDIRKAAALKHELVPGYLVGKEGTTAVIYARLQPRIDSVPDFPVIINGIKEVLAEFEGQGDHEFHITGSPMVAYSFREAATADARTLLPLVLVLVLVCLIATLRRASGVIITLVVLIGCIVCTLGAAGWMGMPINNLTASIPQFLVAIAIATGVHVLKSFDHLYVPGTEKRYALRYALKNNLQPTLLTSVTTAIGFFSFSGADVIPVAHLGILSGIGTLTAWALTYLIGGAMLSLLPLKARSMSARAGLKGRHRARWLDRNKRRIALGFGLLTGGAVAAASTLDIDSDYFAYFAEDAPINVATSKLEEDVGGGLAVEMVLETGQPGGIKDPRFLRTADLFAEWLRQQDYISSAVSVVDFLKATNRSLNGDEDAFYTLPDTREAVAQQYLLYTMSLPQGMDLNDRVSVDESAIRLTTLWTLHSSSEVLPRMEIIRKAAKDMGLDLTITGKNLLLLQMNPYVVDTFVDSVLIAIITVSLLLMLVLRSFKMGLLAMIPNTMPLVYGAALLVLLGQSMDIGTIVVFAICLGIAVDDTVHFLSHYDHYQKMGRTPLEAVGNIFDFTIPALVVTTTTLVIAFGVFGLSDFAPNRMLGVLVAFILTGALVTDLTLLPALLLKPDPRYPKKPRASGSDPLQ